MKNVEIYTDGACSGNPGPGGWGAVLLYRDTRLEISGGEAHTTNNRMELMAAIEALGRLKSPCHVRLFSDSSYLVDSFVKKWIYGWSRNNWVRKRNAKVEPVKNADLWKRLLALEAQHEIEWVWVRGHADTQENNRCDELARAEIVRWKTQQAGDGGEVIP